MQQALSAKKQWAAWLFVGWILWAIFIFNDSLAGISMQWHIQGLLAMGCAALWALVTPLIRKISRRFPLDETFQTLPLLGHLVCSLGTSLVLTAAMTLLFMALQWVFLGVQAPFGRVFPGTAYYFVLVMIVFYWAVIAADSALQYLQALHQKSQQAQALEKQLGEAKLKVLQAQLQPHFLFNTLHSVSALIQVGAPKAAQEVIVDLGDLLRMVLAANQTPFVPLGKEIALVEKYFAIERTRFGDRARFDVQVADALLSAMVPQLCIQPLAENAVRHGLEKSADSSFVTVTISSEEGQLIICVVDDGPGFPPQWEPDLHSGTGLGHTLARLRGYYGEAFTFEIVPQSVGGAQVRLKFPLESMEASGH